MSKLFKPQPLFDTLENIEKIAPKVNGLTFTHKDYVAVLSFLKQYSGNKATFESYRREVERLLQWAWHIKQQSILKLNREQIEEYIQFCLHPPKSWIGFKKVTRFITQNSRRIPNPQWRLFVATVSKFDHKKGLKATKQEYHLSQKTIQEIFTVLSSLYNYLLLEERVKINPIALIKQKSKYLQKRQQQAPVMRLTEKQWQTCLDTVKNIAIHEPEKHERTLFIISAFYLLYLRISELVASDRWVPQMGHFYQDTNESWWFKIVGKGNKLREIAVSDDMLIALKRYRKSMGLSALPSANEKTPLLPKEKGQGAMTSSRHIRRIIQYCFDQTVDVLKKTGFATDAEALESATVHWLRHTGISDDINKHHRPVAHVRDDAGHSSSATTDRYNDIELIERYKSAKNKKIK